MLSILSAIKASPYDPLVEKATSDQNTSEDWQQILEINDRVAVEQNGPKDCLRSIINRLYSDNPWVIIQTLTLLDSLVSNCGKRFHLEICSRDFEQELLRLIRGGKNIHAKVSERTRLLLKKWAQSKDFRKDSQLNLIPSLYEKLKSEGVSFHSSDPIKSRKSSSSTDIETMAKNPDYVANADEEAQLAKAIELSIQEAKKRGIKTDEGKEVSTSSTNQSTNQSLYPSFQMNDHVNNDATTSSYSGNQQNQKSKEPTKVRALYDFEAVEDNELTFKAGEIIIVTDSSDTNWWKGSNHRGEGLFPANFVSLDLNAEPESCYQTSNNNKAESKKVQFNEQVKVVESQDDARTTEVVSIDEGKIDQLMSMLQEADPKSFDDGDDLLRLEEQCLAMMPLIDQQMESIDKWNARLTSLNQQLSSALNLYHDLMKESFLMDQMASMQIHQPTMNNNPYAASAATTTTSQFPMVNGGVMFMPQSQQPQADVHQSANGYYPQPVVDTSTTPQVTAGQDSYSQTSAYGIMHNVYAPQTHQDINQAMMMAMPVVSTTIPQSMTNSQTTQQQQQPQQQKTAVPNLL